MICVIQQHLYRDGGELLLVELHASVYNLTKNNTPPWLFQRFSNYTNANKLHKASHLISSYSELFCKILRKIRVTNKVYTGTGLNIARNDLALEKVNFRPDIRPRRSIFLKKIRTSRVCVALKTISSYCTLINIKRSKHISISIQHNLLRFSHMI